MKFVPSLPPPITVPKESMAVKALVRVKAAKPVQTRSLQPLVIQPHALRVASPAISELQEMRHDKHYLGERRTYCRRTEHFLILVELRSREDRRRHQQRQEDVTEHVDEEI
ncbi:MAG: hypothetical protein ABL911_09665 [Gallionella sp.]